MRDKAARELRDLLERHPGDPGLLVALLPAMPMGFAWYLARLVESGTLPLGKLPPFMHPRVGSFLPWVQELDSRGWAPPRSSPVTPEEESAERIYEEAWRHLQENWLGLQEDVRKHLVGSDKERVRRLAEQIPEKQRAILIITFLESFSADVRHFDPDSAARRRGRSQDEYGRAEAEDFSVPTPHSPRGLSAAPERGVQSGFAAPGSPGRPLQATEPLRPGAPLLYWLEVGPPVAGALETEPVPLPDDLPAEARIEVVLFGFAGEIAVDPEADLGVLRLRPDGAVEVEHQPAAVAAPADLLARRLLFPVRTPERAGIARLRCNLYCRQVLLRSLLVEAVVAQRSPTPPPALDAEGRRLRSRPDYALSRSLSPAHLGRLAEHRLSLMINDGPGGTHDFRFVGAAGEELFRKSVNVDGVQLQAMVRLGREALRLAAWGDAGEWRPEWDPEARYRYARPRGRAELAADLARLAHAGYRLYLLLARELAGRERARLEAAMLVSGLVQVALREAPSFVLPAAILYDIPVDSNAFPVATTEHRLCEQFAAALDGPAPLAECPCFHGACPQRRRAAEVQADPARLLAELGPVVCPSGFWGFRHSIGLPVSVAGAPDAPPEIPYQTAPRIAVGVSTDPRLRLRAEHETALQGLRAGLAVERGATRTEVLKMLKSTRAQLVYFYCHGGVTPGRVPYLEVGYRESGITPDNLEGNGIVWKSPRPLVFINGCHTTALEPEVAIDLVAAFVEDAAAAGVVGTEITVFEPLARDFAEACLGRFLNGAPLGAAVREARLELLQRGNPLGLAYIPFALASLGLAEQAASPTVPGGR